MKHIVYLSYFQYVRFHHLKYLLLSKWLVCSFQWDPGPSWFHLETVRDKSIHVVLHLCLMTRNAHGFLLLHGYKNSSVPASRSVRTFTLSPSVKPDDKVSTFLPLTWTIPSDHTYKNVNEYNYLMNDVFDSKQRKMVWYAKIF